MLNRTVRILFFTTVVCIQWSSLFVIYYYDASETIDYNNIFYLIVMHPSCILWDLSCESDEILKKFVIVVTLA